MKKLKPTKDAATGLTSAMKPQNAELSLNRFEDETEEVSGARGMLNPVIGAAVTMKRQPTLFAPLLNVNAAIAELENQCKAVADGNLARGESMLVAQAHTLDALFNHLAVLAAQNLPGSVNTGERLYRLAFKAQAQCRANIEALAEIKNPRSVAFVKQANIAGGHQQVNNGAPSPADQSAFRDQYAQAHAGKTEIQPTKLMEHKHGERLDIGTAAAAGATNSQVETVGEINRRTNARGKSKGSEERL